MKIALLGYGKMGKTIEKLAKKQNHEIVLKISKENKNLLDVKYLKQLDADVALEFSRPERAFENITTCLRANLPVVSGTTAWLNHYEAACRICKENKGAFLYASNFSLGMNIFFVVNRKLATLMRVHKAYKQKILEIHHTEKLDAPSGTAISLAEGIMLENPRYKKWNLGTEASSENSIPIEARRLPNVPGTHRVTYQSEVDEIEIKHEAKNRDGFALGALLAAQWLVGKVGVFSMEDFMNSM